MTIKNEIKNRISMTLKDPILQQGFEIICRENADLEKENAELKEKLGNVQMQKAGEKSDLVWKLKTANEQKADQLTKAKEIIRDLLNCINYDKYLEIKKKAEQFLKEAGKWE